MKFIGVLAVYLVGFLYISATSADFEQVVLEGTSTATTVDFRITNNGSSAVSLKYEVVIQDNVLMLEQSPVLTLLPGASVSTSFPKEPKSYKITVTEVFSSGQAGLSKVLVVTP
ncbi:MAG: hypothetical protein AAFY76_14990 [Cyanobacteria bacterium J06649_11]